MQFLLQFEQFRSTKSSNNNNDTFLNYYCDKKTELQTFKYLYALQHFVT